MQTTPRATFTAILPNYNHSEFILSALDDAFAQTVPFDEILIIDDASTDGSVALIEERIRGIPQARLIKNTVNLGVIASCNNALREAKGDFVFYMAADDRYSLKIVQWCLEMLEKSPDLAVICSNMSRYYIDTGKTYLVTLPFPQEFATYPGSYLEAVGRKHPLTLMGGINCVLRREAVTGIGGYLPEFQWHCDWFVSLVLSHRHGFAFIPDQFRTFRMAPGQYSCARNDWKRQKPVTEAFLRLITTDFASDYNFFRNAAILPSYLLHTLPLLLSTAEFRRYITPLLLWRLLVYGPLRNAALLLPDDLCSRLRKLIRI